MTRKRSSSYDCPNCRGSYPIGAKTTIFVYKKQPMLDHFVTKCPKCASIGTIWKIVPADIEHIKLHNRWVGDVIEIVTAEFASTSVWKTFCLITGYKFPQERVLTPKQQKYIDDRCDFFAHILSIADPRDVI